MVLIFKNKMVFKLGEKKVFITENGPQATAALLPESNVKINQIPATWDLEKLVETYLEILPLKRGLKFALHKVREGEIDAIKDVYVKELVDRSLQLLVAQSLNAQLMVAGELLAAIERIEKKIAREASESES